MGKTDEEACENQDLSRAECQNVGCCQWAACPITSPGATQVSGRYTWGQCHSAASVGNGQCTSVPWDSHEEDGPHCWRTELKDTHVDGCRGPWWRFNVFNRCGPCEGDCDNDDDCQGYHGTYHTLRGKCFQRNGLTPVPGCKGTGKYNWDYCIYEEV